MGYFCATLRPLESTSVEARAAWGTTAGTPSTMSTGTDGMLRSGPDHHAGSGEQQHSSHSTYPWLLTQSGFEVCWIDYIGGRSATRASRPRAAQRLLTSRDPNSTHGAMTLYCAQLGNPTWAPRLAKPALGT